jgi:hypothetical protein
MSSPQGKTIIQKCISYLEAVRNQQGTPNDIKPYIQAAKQVLEGYINEAPDYEGSDHSKRKLPRKP